VLTYVPGDADAEILTLHAARQWGGVGTALVAALEQIAADQGWGRLWVLTTNDNVDALRFYQRRGFRLTRLHAGAVNQARAQPKREIPPEGEYGIPLRDELVLEKLIPSP
jgi:ribosomal protein S18 acetylase RimI-like enzyme